MNIETVYRPEYTDAFHHVIGGGPDWFPHVSRTLGDTIACPSDYSVHFSIVSFQEHEIVKVEFNLSDV